MTRRRGTVDAGRTEAGVAARAASDRDGVADRHASTGLHESADRGSVTAEFAVVLPAVVAVLVVALVVASAALANLRCADAARAGARAAAIGSSVEEVRAVARTLAGPDAVVAVSRSGPWAVVEVSLRVDGPAWLGGAATASAQARAHVEPTAAGGSGAGAAAEVARAA